MASEQWNDDIAYAMNLFKLVAWPIGVWPLQVYNVYSLIRCAFSTCCAAALVILCAMELYMGCTNAEQNVDCLMLICCGILGMLKSIWFRIYAENLTNNYNSALNDYQRIENTEERAIMRRHAFMGRTLCCVILGFAYFSCVMYAIIPFVGNDENNQINVTNKNVILEYPIPSTCSMQYLNAPRSMYRIICLVDLFILILASTANHGNDALFLNITLHVCGQVKILKAHFINFNVKSPRVYERFNTLIQRHSYLIRLARELADIINFILLIELFIISILLCIMGFQFILALKVNNMVMVTKSLMVQGAFLTQLTLYSFIGNYLKTEMEEIGLCIYQTTWYNFPEKLTRNLVFILMRTDTPVTLQAGNFIMVNLSTYMSIIKTSLSYLSVLRVMVET